MVQSNHSRGEFVGRKREIRRLKEKIEEVKKSRGNVVIISGEAGIGKTRLVEEIIREVKDDFKLITARCLEGIFEPLFPVKEGLREASLDHLIYEKPPYIMGIYLINEAGILMTKAERQSGELDPDIFASMLQAVSSFVQDSFAMMGKTGYGLDTLGYGRYRIIIQRKEKLSLAVVIEGRESEFLMEDMRNFLDEIGNSLDSWDGDTRILEPYREKLQYFITSGKYDGRILTDDPKLKRDNLFDNILLGLKRISEDTPVLMFFDDLQWADSTTLSLLHYIARNTRENRIGIIGTYRHEEVSKINGKVHPLAVWMQNMSREGLFEEIKLKRFSLEDTKRLIKSFLMKADFGDDFYETIYRETEGIPLYILETLKLMIEEGSLSFENGRWVIKKSVDKLGIPRKIYDVIRRRIDRLDDREKDVLQCASVMGDKFSADVIASALGMRKIEILKIVNRIEKMYHLINSINGSYKFSHEKIREVIYKDMIPDLRREYHRMVGETMEKIYADRVEDFSGEIGYHFYMAGDKRAGKYLIIAGDRAKDNYANEEAVEYYTRALEMLSESEKMDVYVKLGDVYKILGDYDKSEDCYNRALKITSEKREIARIKMKIGDVKEKRGKYREAMRNYEEAIQIVDKDDIMLAKIYNSIGRTEYRFGNYSDAMKHAKRAIEMAKDKDDNELARGYQLIGSIYIDKDYDLALKYLTESVKICEKLGDLHRLASNYNNIGVLYWEMGKIEEALKYEEKSVEIMEKIGDKSGMGALYGNIGIIYEERGNTSKALQYYEKALHIAEKIGDKNTLSISLSNVGGVYLSIGDISKALEYYKKGLKIRKEIGNRYEMLLSYNRIASVYMEIEDFKSAIKYVNKAISLSKEIGIKDPLSDSFYLSSYIYSLQGNPKKGLKYAKKSLVVAKEMKSQREIMQSYRAMGVAYREMGEYSKGEEYLHKALEISKNLKINLEYAITLYELGLLYRKKGDKKWVEIMNEALSIFERGEIALYSEKIRNMFKTQ